MFFRIIFKPMCFSLSQIYILFRYIEYFFPFLTLYFSDEFLNILKQNVLTKEQKVLGLSKKSAAYLWEMFSFFFFRVTMYFFFRMPERKRYQKEKGTVCIFEATANAFLPKGQELAMLKQPVLLDGSYLSLFYASKMRTGVCVILMP